MCLFKTVALSLVYKLEGVTFYIHSTFSDWFFLVEPHPLPLTIHYPPHSSPMALERTAYSMTPREINYTGPPFVGSGYCSTIDR